MAEAVAEQPIPDQFAGEIKGYDEHRKEVAALIEQHKDATFDYRTKKGDKEARSHVAKLRKVRTAIDNKRKNEKAEFLRLGRLVDGEAKVLMQAVIALYEPHDEQIKAIEAEEKARVDGINETIELIQTLAQQPADASSAQIESAINQVRGFNGPFDEYANVAEEKRAESLDSLEQQLLAAHQREADAAELARLQKEQQDREQAEREEKIRQEAEAKAKRESEAQVAAAKRQAEEARQEAAKAEETAKANAEAEARRKKQEEDARAADEAHRQSVHDEISGFIVDELGMSKETANYLVLQFAAEQCPHIKIEY